MDNIVVLTYLLILGLIDIRKKAVPLYMLLGLLVIALFIHILRFLKYGREWNIIDVIVSVVFILMLLLAGVAKKMLGMADVVVAFILIIINGPIIAIQTFVTALTMAGCVSMIMLVMKRVNTKTNIAFLPFVFLSYMGVIVCG